MTAHEDPGSSVDGREWFNTTHWSVVLVARDPDSPDASTALDRLCRTYWPPLYAYIRRERYSVDDAKDLTQEFFRRLVQKEWLARLQHQQGKFRSFLLTYVKHFLSDQRDRAGALKRGGNHTLISLDQFAAEERDRVEPVDGLTPDEAFDRRWAKAVLDQAAQRLRQEFAEAGRADLFEELIGLPVGERSGPTYAEIGARLGMSEGAIKSAVRRLRQRHGELLRAEIAGTVENPQQVDEEIRHLMEVLAR